MSTNGVRAVVGSRDVQARLRRPIQQGSLHDRQIPLRWVNGWMVQPPGEAALTAGCRLSPTREHLGPRTQAYRVGQAQIRNRPSERVQTAKILLGRSRNDGQQRIHEFVMQRLDFVHGDTSTNLYNRTCMLIPFVEPSYAFLRQIRFVSQSGMFVFFLL